MCQILEYVNYGYVLHDFFGSYTGHSHDPRSRSVRQSEREMPAKSVPPQPKITDSKRIIPSTWISPTWKQEDERHYKILISIGITEEVTI